MIERYRDNQCTIGEIRQLHQYLQDDQYRQILEDLLGQTLIEPVNTVFTAKPEVQKELAEVYERIMAHRSFAGSAGRIFFRRLISAAAGLLVFLAIGLAWYLMSDRNSPQLASQYGDDVLPADEQAILTLADGRTIVLSESHVGIMLTEQGMKYSDGTEILADGGSLREPDAGSMADLAAVQYFVLTTPKGRQYQITLPDQTTVWLNAASTLKFPSHFNTENREVELEGEAFFDVSSVVAAQAEMGSNALPASIPFIVHTSRQKVRVLGTQFNVSAYADEQTEHLTLVEGKVEVFPAGRAMQLGSNQIGNGLLLTPGYQTVVSEQGMKIRKADVDAVTGWLNGRFNFDNKTFTQVMAELARWYDIEVVYEGTIPEVEFFGDVIRNTNLSTVLYLLETTNVNYKIEGRKLIIMQKTD